MQTWHKIRLDVYRVSYRACRPYQEKIDDFYDNGKIRFQWDMIRQAYLHLVAPKARRTPASSRR